MKKILFSVSICLICAPAFSQWTSNGNTIYSTQNVGVGTETPAYKLDVNGDIRSKNIVLHGGSQISINLSDKFTYNGLDLGQYAFGWMADPWHAGANSLWLSGYGGIKLFTHSQVRVAIPKSGNVGIGTESPIYKLDVNGDFRSKNIVLPGGNQISINLSDKFIYNGLDLGHYALGWMPDPLISQGYPLWMSGYGGIKFFTHGTYRMSIDYNGKVGIGTETPTQRLDVNGNVRGVNFYANGTVFANEVKVEVTKWSDFVFDKDYKLLSLEEVKAHIEEYKHLPDIPSEKEVIEEGINVSEMQAKLLQKIEELTLYVIELKEENKQIKLKLQDL